MPDNNIIETISKIDGLSTKRVNAIAGDPAETSEHTDKFSSLINHPSTQIQAQEVVSSKEVQKVSAPSPMEMAQQVDKRHRDQPPVKSLEELTSEGKETLKKLIEAKRTLETNPNIQFTKPQQLEGTRNLIHVDESLRIALSKVGADKYVTKPVAPTDLSSPVHKFLSYLSNSQYQFEHLNDQIDFLSSSGTNISLANMMALQMKMGIITNQIDFFTGLLSKALEATKTIMNIQV